MCKIKDRFIRTNSKQYCAVIKRTLVFSEPAYLSTSNEQLLISYPGKRKEKITLPIEDLGYIVLEDSQITITNRLLSKLVQNKTLVIICDQQHLPSSILQPLVGHTEQTERIYFQLNASKPLKKQLWQQTIVAKIRNQANHLLNRSLDALKLKRWELSVKSGDSGNHEALSAAYYFQNLFNIKDFSRNQKGIPPNNLLNYGYAVLRAVTARAICSSGLLPSVGIFHRNKYNPFCLADDIMEPYRPFVDALVYEISSSGCSISKLTPSLKTKLLRIPVLDVVVDDKRTPLMNAMSRTTNSLCECFYGNNRRLLYPEFR